MAEGQAPAGSATPAIGKWESAAYQRNCYCGLWDKDPSHYKKEGLPLGFCGFCERCGKPGHTRHFPGPLPYTGSWCDRCHTIVAWTWPLQTPAGWIMILGGGVLLWILARAFWK